LFIIFYGLVFSSCDVYCSFFPDPEVEDGRFEAA